MWLYPKETRSATSLALRSAPTCPGFREFPKALYRHGSTVPIDGHHFDVVVVSSAEEEGQQLGEGYVRHWHLARRRDRVRYLLKGKLKPWIEEWTWLLKPVAGAITLTIELLTKR